MRSRAMMVENIFTMGLCADCLSIGCAQSTTSARAKSSRISNGGDEIRQRAIGGGDCVRVVLADGHAVNGVHLESDDGVGAVHRSQRVIGSHLLRSHAGGQVSVISALRPA